VAVVQYTFTHKQYTEQHNFGRVRALPRLCEFFLTTEEKAWKNPQSGHEATTVSHGIQFQQYLAFRQMKYCNKPTDRQI
jgi:hypothetical protein